MKWLRLVRYHWDRASALVLVVGGLVAVIVAAVRSRDTANVADQLTYLISGGIVGLAVLAIGLTCWLSADLHDDWRQMRLLEESFEASPTPGQPGLRDPASNGPRPAREIRTAAEVS